MREVDNNMPEDDFELDEHTFLLILAAFEYISVTNQLPVVDKFKFNKN